MNNLYNSLLFLFFILHKIIFLSALQEQIDTNYYYNNNYIYKGLFASDKGMVNA